MTNTELRIAVVAYRNGTELKTLLNSLRRWVSVPFHVVVWDNGGSSAAVHDALAGWRHVGDAFAQRVYLAGDGSNLGFARAVNRAAQFRATHEGQVSEARAEPKTEARAEPKAEAPAWTDLLLINPDAELASPLDAATLERVRGLGGLVGFRVFDDEARTSRQASARAFPSMATAVAGREGWLTRRWPANPWSRRYLGASLSDAGPTRVDWVSGCALYASRLTWEKLGGFDEDYFLYVEDVDLGRKAASLGLPVHYAPWVDVVHAIGGSAKQRAAFSDLQHHRGMLRYYRKWQRGPARWAYPLVWAGVWTRFAARRARSWLNMSSATQALPPGSTR